MYWKDCTAVGKSAVLSWRLADRAPPFDQFIIVIVRLSLIVF